MPEAIFLFSPGNCAKFCPCARCDDGTTPFYWTATILGNEYVLYQNHDYPDGCHYKRFVNETIDCGAALEIRLDLIEQGAVDRYTLTVFDGSFGELHTWALDVTPPVDCQVPRTLTKRPESSCGGSDTATITPGPPRNACCPCPEAVEGSRLPCLQCEPGTPPAQLQLVISGIQENPVPNSCDECPTLDGTYILDQGGFNGCVYRADFDKLCGYNSVILIIESSAYTVVFTFDGSFHPNFTFSFRLSSLPSPRDCSSPAGLDIPHQFTGANSRCSGTGASCFLTAL